jgi:hypothetical protein
LAGQPRLREEELASAATPAMPTVMRSNWLDRQAFRLLGRPCQRDSQMGPEDDGRGVRQKTRILALRGRYHPEIGNQSTEQLMANINAARTIILQGYRKD